MNILKNFDLDEFTNFEGKKIFLFILGLNF